MKIWETEGETMKWYCGSKLRVRILQEYMRIQGSKPKEEGPGVAYLHQRIRGMHSSQILFVNTFTVIADVPICSVENPQIQLHFMFFLCTHLWH